LAKLRVVEEATSEITATEMTRPGAVLGTLQYMAPEQIQGKEADARSDVFALGGVLFEMATRRKAFEGSGRSGLMGAILNDEPPPISSLTPASPPTLDRLVEKCLAKEPEQRWQSAHDLKIELEWILAAQTSPITAPVLNARSISEVRAQRLLPAAAAIFLIAAILFAAAYFKQPRPDGRGVVQLSIGPPDKTSFTSEVLSPDGHRLAFTTIDAAGRRQLWVRALDEGSAQPVAGAEGAWNPFWSPDSRWIGFFADAKLKKIEATREGQWNLYQKPTDGSGEDELLVKSSGVKLATDWSPDGRFLLFDSDEAKPGRDLWAVRLAAVNYSPSL
jgi:eukaryotic-like serine/threonine-protein kinase